MLRSVKDLIGYPVEASDGKIGRITDCLLDDVDYHIRHFVVDTGSIAHIRMPHSTDGKIRRKHEVLVDPDESMEPSYGKLGRHFSVNMTRDMIEHSPDMESDTPVSTQYTQEFSQFIKHIPYGSQPHVWDYFGAEYYTPPTSMYEHDPKELERHEIRLREIGKNHLRSLKELISYRVFAGDERVGHVEDFILHDRDWMVRQIVIKFPGWLKKRKVLVETNTIANISWTDSRMTLDLSREDVELSPEYRPHFPVNQDQEKERFDYLGKPCSK